MFKSVIVGLVLIGITVSIHAVGSTWWIRSMKRRNASPNKRLRPRKALTVLMSTAIFLLTLHILEVVLWGMIYVLLPELNEIRTIGDGIYFSFITFTTLGYGDITLNHPWRLLSGIEAMNGILLFGWSTAMLFAVVQRIWKSGNESAD